MRRVLLTVGFAFLGTFAASPEMPNPNDEDGLWRQWMSEGDDARRRRDFEAAASAYGMAVYRAERLPIGGTQLAWALSALGDAYAAASRFHEALPPMIRSLELRRELPDYCSTTTAYYLDHTADTYARIGEFGERAALVLEAAEIREAIGKEVHISVGALVRVARGITTQDPERAEALLVRALELSELTSRSDPQTLPDVLRGLGQFFASRPDGGERALSFFRHAVENLSEQDTPDPDEWIYRTRAVIRQLDKLGRFQEAAPLCREIVAKLRAQRGPRHYELAEALWDRSAVLERSGDLEDAEVSLREAVAISDGSWGPDHCVVRFLRNELVRITAQRGTDPNLGDPEPLEPDPRFLTALHDVGSLLTSVASGRLSATARRSW